MIWQVGWRSLKVMAGSFFCYFVFCEFFFITHITGGVMRPLAKLVFIPAATVDGRAVSYDAVADLARGLRAFDPQLEKQDAFEQALSVSVYRLYIKEFAQEAGVEVTSDELETYPVDETHLAPILEAAKWKQPDYQRYVIEPLLLAQKTELAITDDDKYQADALAKIEGFEKKLDQGLLLGDLAQTFSEDPSAAARGDLGIMSMGDVPEWLKPATTLEIEEISPVLHAPDAYWIVSVTEFYPSSNPDQAAIHFRGAAVKKIPFGVIVNERVLEQPAWVWVW